MDGTKWPVTYTVSESGDANGSASMESWKKLRYPNEHKVFGELTAIMPFYARRFEYIDQRLGARCGDDNIIAAKYM